MPLRGSLGHHYMLWWIKWRSFWLTRGHFAHILLNIHIGWPLWRASITAHRSPSTRMRCAISWYLWENSAENLESPGASKARECDRFKGFNGFNDLQRHQRLSMAFRGFRAVQRRSLDGSLLKDRFRGSKLKNNNGEIENSGVLQKCNTFKSRCCTNATSLWHTIVYHCDAPRHNIL